MDIISS